MFSGINMAGHLIRRLHQQSTQMFQAQTQDAGFDLTSVQFAALEAISRKPGIDQASLGISIGLDRTTIGGVVERLEQKGLVQRFIEAQDRRPRHVHLTSEGERLLAACCPVIERLQVDILGSLSTHERETLLLLMRKALGLDGA